MRDQRREEERGVASPEARAECRLAALAAAAAAAATAGIPTLGVTGTAAAIARIAAAAAAAATTAAPAQTEVAAWKPSKGLLLQYQGLKDWVDGVDERRVRHVPHDAGDRAAKQPRHAVCLYRLPE